MSQAVSNKGLATACHWLFFQHAIQVQLHGGKNPIVLYWEMKLQDDLHAAMSQLQLPCNDCTRQVSLPGHKTC